MEDKRLVLFFATSLQTNQRLADICQKWATELGYNTDVISCNDYVKKIGSTKRDAQGKTGLQQDLKERGLKASCCFPAI